jgi:hypothetical protein
VALVNLDELLDEVLNGRFVRLATALAAHDGDRPALQRRTVRKKELLALEIPAARCTRRSDACAVLHLGRGEKAALDNGPRLADLETVLLKSLISIP